ncbi:MAG TPA: TonB-dependent receptor [Povalibacter sp.]|uniref:TonB-dependent receptor n=2 Tax=Povalibacter sp. TaxID=1962978 RepID=UPI002BB870CE|nr:TonB-dependent receptor [Povalibacter sp.]HMN47018.1 TonB-dependent receptor [Povalibacter sp.]
MRGNSNRTRHIASLLGATLATSTWMAAAQDTGALEEIIVTATKREQTLQDVPISVAVTPAAVLEQAQIRDLIDLQSVVPSLKVSQLNAVGQTNFIIRGFGNGAGNDGIESSVGVFIDGVYRSRSAAALDDLPEVERIEVLRGPQSTLFGKNVSAGAISIVTRKPESEFGGSAEVGFGNYDSKYAKASITGPIGDTLAFRLSGNINQRDGYLENSTTGNDVNDRDRWAVRGDVLWTPTDAVSLRVIADYSEINEVCCGVVQLRNGPASQVIGAPTSVGGMGRPIDDPATLFDGNIVFNTDPANALSGRGISAQLDWEFGAATLTSITAWRNQKNQSYQDVDFTGADIVNKDQANDISTFTQELRLASSGEGRVDWLLGAFFQDESLDTGVDTIYAGDIRGYADRLSGPSANSPGMSNLQFFEYLQGLVTPQIVPGQTYFQPGQGISDHYAMDQRSYSVFSQVDFHVTDRFTLTGGLAYLDDRKEARSNVVMNEPFSALDLQNVPQLPYLGLPANAFAALGGLQFFYGNTANHGPVNYPNANESGVLEGDKLTYAVRAAYDFGAFNAYASYSTGWKAGAYNLSSDSRPPDVNGVGRSAGPEDVEVYEIGLKATFNNGYLNVAVFDQSIDGFQSNAYTGTGYNLVNAGEESVKGVEIDLSYAPTNWLALTAAATYLDAEYESFTQAACVSYDTVRCPVDPLTGRMPNFRDLSGQRPAGIPEWTASVSATLSHEFGSDYTMFLRGEYDYVDDTWLTETTPPDISTWGQSVVNASIGLTNQAQQWDISIWGRNLTDDETIVASFPTVAQDGSYSGYLYPPRTYGLTLRKRF